MTIRLPVRQYIGVPSGEPRGLVTATWELPVAETAFIELHCWNVGVPGGLSVPDDYWVFMGSKQNHERAARIMSDTIAPCLDAARHVGLATVHVQPESIALRHVELLPRPGRAPVPSRPPIDEECGALAESHVTLRAEAVHGKGYTAWEGWQRLDVAPTVKPQPSDAMVVTTEEFDEWLQARGIATLIYTGFAANLCILDSPCAMKAMNSLGYRCILLREGTMAIEFPDQPPGMHTDVALRYVESWAGYTASADDFIRACGEVGR